MTDDNPRILEHIHHSLTYTVYDTKWIPKSARFVSLGSYPRQSGVIEVYSLKDGNKVCFLLLFNTSYKFLIFFVGGEDVRSGEEECDKMRYI